MLVPQGSVGRWVTQSAKLSVAPVQAIDAAIRRTAGMPDVDERGESLVAGMRTDRIVTVRKSGVAGKSNEVRPAPWWWFRQLEGGGSFRPCAWLWQVLLRVFWTM